jgi:5-formyltetrahydrofolate cyclo-ligase
MGKADLRRALKIKRSALSSERRHAAASAARHELLALCTGTAYVLSFASFASEIDLNPLNQNLAAQGRLLLPRVQGRDLGIYRVSDYPNDLQRSRWGILEPLPSRCQAVEFTQASHILVAGLAFDNAQHRLGYGRGYYDRLLDKCPFAQSIGVAFKEQLLDFPLPRDSWDRPVDALCLL